MPGEARHGLGRYSAGLSREYVLHSPQTSHPHNSLTSNGTRRVSQITASTNTNQRTGAKWGLPVSPLALKQPSARIAVHVATNRTVKRDASERCKPEGRKVAEPFVRHRLGCDRGKSQIRIHDQRPVCHGRVERRSHRQRYRCRANDPAPCRRGLRSQESGKLSCLSGPRTRYTPRDQPRQHVVIRSHNRLYAK
jgi:hypothetical protein